MSSVLHALEPAIFGDCAAILPDCAAIFGNVAPVDTTDCPGKSISATYFIRELYMHIENVSEDSNGIPTIKLFFK